MNTVKKTTGVQNCPQDGRLKLKSTQKKIDKRPCPVIHIYGATDNQ